MFSTTGVNLYTLYVNLFISNYQMPDQLEQQELKNWKKNWQCSWFSLEVDTFLLFQYQDKENLLYCILRKLTDLTDVI